jgi:hypothetical protein
MPSPDAANSPMAAKKAQTKPGDLAQKLARSRSQEFKSKILDWNQAGGGVAPEPSVKHGVGKAAEIVEPDPMDEIVVIEEDDDPPVVVVEAKPDTDKPQSPLPTKSPVTATKAAHARKTSKDIDRERKAWVRRKSKPQVDPIIQEEVEDIKAATTPKKRVVSDGHWRRDRSASKPQSGMLTPENDSPPKPITIRRSVVNVGLKVPPSVQDFYEEPEPEPVRRRPISSQGHSRRRSRDDRDDVPDYEDSGVRLYIKRRPRSKTSAEDPKKTNSKGSSFVSSNQKSLSTDITTPSTPAAKEIKGKPATAPREKTSSTSLTSEDNAKRLDPKRTRTPEARKRASPKPEPKSTPTVSPIVPKVFGGRIEGWLATTSDPFSGRPSAQAECSQEAFSAKPGSH